MAPSTHLEVPPQQEVERPQTAEILVREPPKVVPVVVARPAAEPRALLEEGSFRSSLIEYNQMKSGSRTFDIFVSLLVNCSVLIAPLLAGLFFTDTINLKQLETTFLAAPPPPPPPPPAPVVTVVRAAPVHRVFENAGKLIAPTVVPKTIAEIKESPLPPDMDSGGGVPGGVPGGVAGGSLGGVMGGVIGGVTTTVPLAPLVPKDLRPKAPLRVGGRVKEPLLVHRVEPTYPPLAKQTRIQGTVVIDAVIDEHGDIAEMKVLSGPPLLISAAMDAVRQWKYQPTYLNDEPVPVQLSVTVTFRISQ